MLRGNDCKCGERPKITPTIVACCPTPIPTFHFYGSLPNLKPPFLFHSALAEYNSMKCCLQNMDTQQTTPTTTITEVG